MNVFDGKVISSFKVLCGCYLVTLLDWTCIHFKIRRNIELVATKVYVTVRSFFSINIDVW